MTSETNQLSLLIIATFLRTKPFERFCCCEKVKTYIYEHLIVL
mgnify:CR=1 FL=1